MCCNTNVAVDVLLCLLHLVCLPYMTRALLVLGNKVLILVIRNLEILITYLTGLSSSAMLEFADCAVFVGGPVDKLAPNAHSSCWCSCGSAGKTNPGGWRSRRGPEPPEGGGDVQHRRREVAEKECSSGGLNGCIHHCERYRLYSEK